MRNNIQTEKLKYGIGIVADYSSLALGTRVIEQGSVVVDGKRYRGEIREAGIGIIDNPLFSYIAESVKDCFEIRIDSITSSLPEDERREFEVERSPGITVDNEISPLRPLLRRDSGRDDVPFPLSIEATKETAATYIRIVVEPGVKTTIHEQLLPKDFLGAIIDVEVGEGADVVYIADQRAGAENSVIALRRAFVSKDATMKWIDLAIGAGIANSTIYTMLDAPAAVGETYGLFYGRGEQLHDIAHTTIHRAPHTTSNLKTNGVLDDKAKAIYRSLIDIQENAVNADGQQKEETLLLSRDAQVSSVPDLEIANNEVTCSHGVSTTNISDDDLFYFHSRGVETSEARQAIVHGHLGAILDEIEDESIRLRVYEELQNRTQISRIASD